MSAPNPPVQVNRTGTHSFQAHQDDDVFVIRQTTQGWKTEGHPVHDGLLCQSMDDLLAHLEGRTR